MTERLVAEINIREMKVNAMVSKIKHSVITPEEVSQKFYTDHLLANTNYLEGNTGAWVYTNKKSTVAFSCTKPPEALYTLQLFTDDVGVLYRLKSDLAPEISGKYTEF